MRTMHFLADVYGPRLTGSPNHKAAAEWAAKQMTDWGFVNAHLEAWDFGHPGWTNEIVQARIVSPMKAALVVQPLAWTPGTSGPVTAKAFNLIAPQGPEVPQADGARGGGRGPQRQGPTQAELTAYLDGIKAKVNGAAVLVGTPAVVPVNFEAEATRLTDVQAKCRYEENAGHRSRLRSPARPRLRQSRRRRAGRARPDRSSDHAGGQPADRRVSRRQPRRRPH